MENQEVTYKIVRLFKDNDRRPVMASGLSLSQAQAWCRDKETSSRTCTKKILLKYTESVGEWFDGYEQEVK